MVVNRAESASNNKNVRQAMKSVLSKIKCSCEYCASASVLSSNFSPTTSFAYQKHIMLNPRPLFYRFDNFWLEMF